MFVNSYVEHIVTYYTLSSKIKGTKDDQHAVVSHRAYDQIQWLQWN